MPSIEHHSVKMVESIPKRVKIEFRHLNSIEFLLIIKDVRRNFGKIYYGDKLLYNRHKIKGTRMPTPLGNFILNVIRFPIEFSDEEHKWRIDRKALKREFNFDL